MLSLVDHCKSSAAAAAANAGDVADVSVVDDFQTRLSSEVVEILDEIFALRKHIARVGAEAFRGLLVARVGDKRVPVVTEIEFDVRFTGVTLVDAQ